MKTIAFHENNLCLRGTTNAVFDYADYNEKILGNKSIILCSPYGNLDAFGKFEERFGDKVILSEFNSYGQILDKYNVDYLYMIKPGENDGLLAPNNIPTLVHSVFGYNEPHGHKYCYVSDWLAKSQGYDPIDYSVPHMVTKLPEPNYDLREKLGIRKTDIVFGYLGGPTSFDHQEVKDIVRKIVNERDDIYFIFMNIDKFIFDSLNVIHLPGTWNLNEKSSFINACDAMLHARKCGETFGCSVAEYSIMNKPVIAYSDAGDKSHLDILGDRAILYHNTVELYDILNNFKSYLKYDDYYKAYDNYSPEKIMERFYKNFLS